MDGNVVVPTPSDSDVPMEQSIPPAPTLAFQASEDNANEELEKYKDAHWELVNMRPVLLANRSLCFFTTEHPFRKLVLKVIFHKYFEKVVIALIVLNSIVLALTDYSMVDADNSPVSSLNGKTSFGNNLVENTELFFTIGFTIECVLKVIGLGFVTSHGSYLRQGWNVLDFVVVVSGFLGSLPGMPNISVLRTFRVLRPLRSLTIIPGMKLLINSMLQSIPALMNVLVLLLFVFAVFGILGLKMWVGLLQTRCRLTEFPVKLDANGTFPASADYLATVLANPTAFRCLDQDNNNGAWTQVSSPWSTPQNCFWPIDEDITRVCGLPGNAGNFFCPAGRTCGSNYDEFGNPRFASGVVMNSNRIEDLNWGFTKFDDVFSVFLTIFQVITMEGWTDVMYQVQDAYNPFVAALYFVLLVLFGAFFIVNLTLAVIWDNFEAEEEHEAHEAEERHADLIRTLSKRSGLGLPENGASNGRVMAEGGENGDTSAPMSSIDETQPMASEDADSDDVPVKSSGFIRPFYVLVNHKCFGNLILVLIVLNTGVLACDSHPMDPSFQSTLELMNLILSLLFTVEMVLKLLGLGIREYLHDSFNVFDAVIVIVSTVEIIVSPPEVLTGVADTDGSGGSAVSVLRTFRLFRVFKLTRSWVSLRLLLEKIVQTISDVTNFAILLVLFIYIYALVGMQMFANVMRFDPDTGALIEMGSPGYESADIPRHHFDNLYWACVTIFQVLSGENWNVVMYDGWRAAGVVSPIYFLSLIIFGMFITLNLFVAILLGNFEGMAEAEEAENKPLERKELEVSRTRRMTTCVVNATSPDKHGKKPPPLPTTPPNPHAKRYKYEGEIDIWIQVPLHERICVKIDSDSKEKVSFLQNIIKGTTHAPVEEQTLTFGDTVLTPNQHLHDTGILHNSTITVQDIYGKSMGVLPHTSPLRMKIAHFVRQPKFETVLLVLIIISSLMLAIESPFWQPDGTAKQVFGVIDTILTMIFLLECLVKIVAFGLLFQKGAYLRNNWNVLDFLIVLLSILSMFLGSDLKSTRSLRTFRALRPLRMISHKPELKLVVNALFAAIPNIWNVIFVCLLFFLLFSIFMVNYFKGAFNACMGSVFDGLSPELHKLVTHPVPFETVNGTSIWPAELVNVSYAVPTSKAICLALGAEWDAVVPQNFDNVFNGIGSLFEMSTTEGWVDVMYAGVDSVGIDMQPIRDNSEGWAVFFIFYMIVGAFFIMNLFVGVVIDSFNFMKNKIEESAVFLSAAKKKWVKKQTYKPVRDSKQKVAQMGSFQQFFYDIVHLRWFDPFIMGCIIVNTLLMTMSHLGQPHGLTMFFQIMNYIFAFTFTVECILKLIALRRKYFHDRWNVFDFFIVWTGNSGLIVKWVSGYSVGSFAAVFRTFRVGRLFRLVHGAKSLQKLFNTLLVTLPSLGNIGGLLFLLQFIYAILGVQLFSMVKHGDYLSVHANFENFPNAWITLMRSCTGESWNGLMVDLARTTDCAEDVAYDPAMCGFSSAPDCIPLNGCGSKFAYFYFFSFTLVVTFVILNIFIAVILEGFSTSSVTEDSELNDAEMSAFSDVYKKLGNDLTSYVGHEDLVQMLEEVEEGEKINDEQMDRLKEMARARRAAEHV